MAKTVKMVRISDGMTADVNEAEVDNWTAGGWKVADAKAKTDAGEGKPKPKPKSKASK